MAVQWGLAGGNAYGNALAVGMQMGSQAREAQDRREYRNALAGYDPSNPETLRPVMAANPEVGLKLRADAEKRSKEAQLEEVTRRAAGGDKAAMAELAGIDLDGWRGLSKDQRDAADQQTTVLANAALDILQRPPEQRAAVWDAYIDQLSATMPDLARYKGQYSEQSARAVVAQSDMITKLHEAEKPNYRVVPEGADLVDIDNPSAIQGYQAGTPRQTKQVGGKSYFQDENGDWYEGGAAGNRGGTFP